MIKLDNYSITFDKENKLGSLIEKLTPSKITVLADTNTAELCMPFLFEECPMDFNIISIESGEEYKTIETCQYIWRTMIDLEMDRHSLLINLGGGVVGDMGGFCASTYMRGIPFIQIPTTLLSQVDSSVGGKLGVDFGHFKNMVGLFANPEAVMIDSRFLSTLPYRQMVSGFAEIVKHGLIADRKLWDDLWQEEIITDLDLSTIVERSVQIKADIVTQDPYEKGIRKILNFGHTIGHAIESIALSSDNPLLHGEAILIGMIVESHISFQKGLLTSEDFNTIKETILKLSGQKSKSIPDLQDLLDVMKHDKKNHAGQIKMSLLTGIGSAIFNQDISSLEVEKGIAAYKF